MQKEPTLLEAALTGYQHEADEIKRRIADIVKRLRGLGVGSADRTSGPTRARRKVSAAARKRMAAAQRRRWAAVRKRAAK